MNMRLPLIVMLFFTAIGAVVSLLQGRITYFYFFAGLGVLASAAAYAIIRNATRRQAIRLALICVVGLGLFVSLSLYAGINFQFPQIFFDAMAGVVTGALIQFVVARVVGPFIFGNGFCSRACWNGAIFELTAGKKTNVRALKARSELVAWFYLLALAVLAITVSRSHNPADSETARRWWIIGENVLITVLGLGLAPLLGRRAYCRLLCPFITVSGLISRFSAIKIEPVQPDACIKCEACNRACPMGVDVMASVANRARIADRKCIICERCVDACPKACLELTVRLPWK